MKHIIQLDGIRGLAVAVVVLFHFQSVLGIGVGRIVALLAVGRFLLAGWLGVDMFFVLSGFLITGIILDGRSEHNFWSTFYVRRALRILPAVAIVFVTTMVAAHFLLPEVRFRTYSVVLSIFFMANWTVLTSELPILSHLWSLAVEEQFYFLWPQAAKRLSVGAVLKLAAVLAVACEILRVGLALAHVNVWIIYKITPTSIDGLAIGAALAAGLTMPHIKQFLTRRWSTIALAAAGTIVTTFVALRGSLFVFSIWSQVIAVPAVAVLVAMLIYASVDGVLPRFLARFFGHPAMTWLGRRSYGLYLIHVPIQFAAGESRTHGVLAHLPSGLLVNVLVMVTAISVSLILAEISWRLIEAPAQRLRRVLLAKRAIPVS